MNTSSKEIVTKGLNELTKLLLNKSGPEIAFHGASSLMAISYFLKDPKNDEKLRLIDEFVNKLLLDYDLEAKNYKDLPVIQKILKVKCMNCFKEPNKLFKCNCGMVSYCNVVCQKEHWIQHKDKHKFFLEDKEKN